MPTRERITADIGKSFIIVALATFISRILGLLREQVFAYLFGAGMRMDAFVVAFRVPNLLRDLFAEGALSSAFIAVFSEYKAKRSLKEQLNLVNNVIITFTIILFIIIMFMYILSDKLVVILAGGFTEVSNKYELTLVLTEILLPFLYFVSMAAIFHGFLISNRYYFVPSISSGMFNLSSIFIGGFLAIVLPRFGIDAIIGMAIGTLVGGVMQLLIQLPLSMRLGYSFNFYFNLGDEGLRKIVVMMLPAIVGLSAMQINVFINTNFASKCGDGAVSWLNYAFRLFQLPTGLIGVALSYAVLPDISRYKSLNDMERFKDSLVTAINLLLVVSIPSSIGLYLLSDEIIKLIYEYGSFTMFDTIETAGLLRLYCLGIVFYCGIKILVPAFYALNDTKWPVIASFCGVGFNIVFLSYTIDIYKQSAIAFSTSFVMVINFMILYFVLIRKIGHLGYSRILRSLIKTCVASFVVLVVSLLVKESLSFVDSRIIYSIIVLLGVLVCAILFFLVCYFVRHEEIMILVRSFRSKLGR